MLFSLLLFTYNAKRGQLARYTAAIFCFILALLSKEMALIFPFILLLYYLIWMNGEKKFPKFPVVTLFLISAIYILLRLTILNFAKKSLFENTLSIAERLLLASKVFIKYLALYIAPIHLHMERTISIPKSFFDISVLLFVGIIIAAVMFFLKKLRSYKIFVFGALWVFISFVPISNIFPLNARIAEHWFYLPSIGLIILIAAVIDKLSKIYKEKIVMLCAIPIVALYSGLTIIQNNYWNNGLQMYQKTLYYSPNSSRVHYNLGNAYEDIRQDDKAIQSYEEAIRLKSDYTDAYYNLANLYRNKKLYDKAIETYQKALTINPNSFDIHNNLALTYINIGVKDQAIAEFKEVLRINPRYAEGYNNLGSIYLAENSPDKAVEMLKKAIEINPGLVNAHDSLGIIYSQQGLYDQAITEFEAVLKLDPARAATHNDLGLLYANTGQFVLARHHWERALQINPSLNAARNNLKKLEEMGY